jgi:curved DNA-binding protein CbpA
MRLTVRCGAWVRCTVVSRVKHGHPVEKVQHVHQARTMHYEPARPPTSPYDILGLERHASREQIRATFRSIAKKLHPDVNRSVPADEASRLMAELIQAHDMLMDDSYADRVGDSRVAASCELFSLDEMRKDGLHSIYPIRILFPTFMLEEGRSLLPSSLPAEDNSDTFKNSVVQQQKREEMYVISASPDDSGLDLKQSLETEFGEAWGITDRRRSREGAFMGWELVQEAGLLEGGSRGNVVLSYHLFLHDYGIQHGDILHAVVRGD